MVPPSTPMTPRYGLTVSRYKPQNSSPLAPTREDSPAQTRRKAQYKSKTSSRTPKAPAASSSKASAHMFDVHSSGKSVFNWFYRRVAEERANAMGRRRYVSERSSDGFDVDHDDAMDDDDEEDDEAIMQDEIFRRIVANENSRHKSSYRRSYAREVGSSFDPALEDVNEWEQVLKGSSSPSETDIDDLLVELDDEEVQAYAEEYASQAALAEFEDIPGDEPFTAEDLAELDALEQAASTDVDMN